jgi:hypothetical protein
MVADHSDTATHNSWIILSKLMTENKREEMAAPEMSASATIRSNDEVVFTVAGETSAGSVYATAMI